MTFAAITSQAKKRSPAKFGHGKYGPSDPAKTAPKQKQRARNQGWREKRAMGYGEEMGARRGAMGDG